MAQDDSTHIKISAFNIDGLDKAVKRLNGGNLFAPYLEMTGFELKEPNLYFKEKPEQLISLQVVDGQTIYTNQLNKEDKGTLLQFISNRLPDPGKIIPNDSVSTFLNAVMVGVYYETKIKGKQKRAKKSSEIKPHNKKGRGK